MAISVYRKSINLNITRQQEEAFKRYNRLIQWGRKNPVQFIENVFGIKLTDYQKWMISCSWVAEYVVWLCSRSTGKSFLIGCYSMARGMLFPSQNICILSASAAQANSTFKKLENIAKNNIASLIGVTSVFLNEIIKSNSDSDGFTHGDKGYMCHLYNGTTIKTIVGTDKTARGERSTLNFYDEAGFMEEKFFKATEPFTAQNSDFVTGGGIDPRVYPQNIPNQNIYASSAGSVNDYLYRKYKDFAKKMFIGDRRYFVADVPCSVPLAPKMNGVLMPPLLKKAEIDQAMADDEETALREYYNKFDKTGGSDCMVHRSDIVNNEYPYLPLFRSDDPNKTYIIAFDPASRKDNSFVLVTELFQNEQKQYCGKVVYGVNLIERLNDNSKRILIAEEQVAKVWDIIVGFNNIRNEEYTNIIFLIDVGAGGGGELLAQQMWNNWKDRNGITHVGIIDKEFDDRTRDQALAHPQAVDKCKQLKPNAMRTQAFEAAEYMVANNMIMFPGQVPKDRIYGIGDDAKKLNEEEFSALIELSMMKEELVHFVKRKNNNGSIIYELENALKRKGHDDRAYCFAMTCYYIRLLNTNTEVANSNSQDFSNFGKKFSESLTNIQRTNKNPFNSGNSPFMRKR